LALRPVRLEKILHYQEFERKINELVTLSFICRGDGKGKKMGNKQDPPPEYAGERCSGGRIYSWGILSARLLGDR
jgi:hypothetical protein